MRLKELMQILTWEVINPGILKLKRKRKYKISKDYNGINIGCGINNPINWVGVDCGFSLYLLRKIPKCLFKLYFKKQSMSSNYSFEEYYRLSRKVKLIHHDVLYGLPFNNNSVPNIFSSHFLEHLFYNEAEFILKECYRVLKPNGIIRICVPSLSNQIESIELAIKNYKLSNTDEIQKYVTSNIVGYNSYYSNHRYMYDWNRLLTILERTGFKDIQEHSFQKGNICDVEMLDTRKGIFVEAYK